MTKKDMRDQIELFVRLGGDIEKLPEGKSRRIFAVTSARFNRRDTAGARFLARENGQIKSFCNEDEQS
jgi:hypothetical protein